MPFEFGPVLSRAELVPATKKVTQGAMKLNGWGRHLAAPPANRTDMPPYIPEE